MAHIITMSLCRNASYCSTGGNCANSKKRPGRRAIPLFRLRSFLLKKDFLKWRSASARAKNYLIKEKASKNGKQAGISKGNMVYNGRCLQTFHNINCY